jgi:hypothetical protein
MKAGLCVAILLVSSPASAQRVELAAFGGYTTSGQIEQTALNVQDLRIRAGLTWGGQATYFISPAVGIAALWTYQATDMGLSTSSGTARLFTMTMNQLYGSVMYQFRGREAAARPFVFGGLGGATFFNGSDMTAQTKFAWTAGGGLKWFLSTRVGFAAQARFTPTVLHDESAELCVPFGFCQDSMSRFEIAIGPTFRF